MSSGAKTELAIEDVTVIRKSVMFARPRVLILHLHPLPNAKGETLFRRGGMHEISE